ncbi:MAG: Hsp20/alpha crystallin family protein [Chloroflexota bacterium]|nr:MAG: Hsp20/alpha crystallin family protein [Chloroflexota bacterium]
MVAIVRREDAPFVSLRNAMDRLFDDSFTSPWWISHANSSGGALKFPMDIWSDQDNYYLSASLPGVNPDDVQITGQNNELTISAEFKAEQREGATALVRERPVGSYKREIAFPTDVAFDRTEAVYQNGVLVLTLPKAEHAKARTIKVKAGEPTH